MADDIVNPRGTISAYKNEGQKTGNDAPYPVIGIVKDNVDENKTGRIRVYIADFGAPDPNVDSSWQTVDYLSPFYGHTDPSSSNTGYGDYTSNPHSYGFWATAPDIGTKVLCIFPNGKKDFGFYIGCIPETNKTHMVPAVGATKEVTLNKSESDKYGGAVRLPVTEINTNNAGINDSPTAQSSARPVHSYQASLLFQQGLLRDPVRGPISSSSVRETPSRVFGMSTPGRPIYKGGYDDTTITQAPKSAGEKQKIIGRRGGHSIVMDDGDIKGSNQLIRIRTALGHQITMSDDGQTLFIIHSNGQSYIELGKEGTVDIFSTNSFNVRTQGDINFHADNNVNINAKKNFNVYAETMNIESQKNFSHRVGGEYKVFAKGKLTALSEGAMALNSTGEMAIACSGTTFINGTKINLNTGSAGTSGQVVDPMEPTAQTDTLWDSAKGWLAAPGKLPTITSRAPAHMPWVNSNLGVDVKVTSNANDVLPAPTTNKQTAAATNAAGSAPEQPVTTAAVATVPPTEAAGGNIDEKTTAAAVGQTAATVATGPAAAAVKAGAGVITDGAGGLTAAVGKLGLNPAQLSDAGIIKPGSASLITKALNSGKSLFDAIPKQLFTGKAGVSDLTSLISNPPAQVGAQVNLMQKGFNSLVNNGTINGNESSTAITGLVSASASVGADNVTSFAKSVAGDTGGVGSGQTLDDRLKVAFGTNEGGSLRTSLEATGTSLGGSLDDFGNSIKSSYASGGISGALDKMAGGSPIGLDSLNGLGGGANPLSSVKNLIAGGNFAGGMTQQVNGVLGGLGLNKSAGGLSGLKDMASSAFAKIKSSLPQLPAGKPVNLAQKTAEAEAVAVAEDNKSAADSGKTGENLNDKLSKAFGVNEGGSLRASLTQTGTSLGSSFSNFGDSVKSSFASDGVSGALDKMMSGGTAALGIGQGSDLSPKGILDKGLGIATSAEKSLSTTVSSVSSGIKSLAGGVGGVSNLVDKSAGAVNSVPGLDNVSATGSLGSLKSMANNALGSITGGKSLNIGSLTNGNLNASLTKYFGVNEGGSLRTSLEATGTALGSQLNSDGILKQVSSGLAGGEVAKLSSMLKSIPGGGVKAPTVAINTLDRGSVNTAVTEVIPEGVPPPKFEATVEKPDAEKEKLLTNLKQELADIRAQIKEKDEFYKKNYAEILQIKESAKGLSKEEATERGLVKQFNDKQLEGLKNLEAKADLQKEEDKIIEAIRKVTYS